MHPDAQDMNDYKPQLSPESAEDKQGGNRRKIDGKTLGANAFADPRGRQTTDGPENIHMAPLQNPSPAQKSAQDAFVSERTPAGFLVLKQLQADLKAVDLSKESLEKKTIDFNSRKTSTDQTSLNDNSHKMSMYEFLTENKIQVGSKEISFFQYFTEMKQELLSRLEGITSKQDIDSYNAFARDIPAQNRAFYLQFLIENIQSISGDFKLASENAMAEVEKSYLQSLPDNQKEEKNPFVAEIAGAAANARREDEIGIRIKASEIRYEIAERTRSALFSALFHTDAGKFNQNDFYDNLSNSVLFDRHVFSTILEAARECGQVAGQIDGTETQLRAQTTTLDRCYLAITGNLETGKIIGQLNQMSDAVARHTQNIYDLGLMATAKNELFYAPAPSPAKVYATGGQEVARKPIDGEMLYEGITANQAVKDFLKKYESGATERAIVAIVDNKEAYDAVPLSYFNAYMEHVVASEQISQDLAQTTANVLGSYVEKGYDALEKAKTVSLAANTALTIGSYVPVVGPFAMSALIGLGMADEGRMIAGEVKAGHSLGKIIDDHLGSFALYMFMAFTSVPKLRPLYDQLLNSTNQLNKALATDVNFAAYAKLGIDAYFVTDLSTALYNSAGEYGRVEEKLKSGEINEQEARIERLNIYSGAVVSAGFLGHTLNNAGKTVANYKKEYAAYKDFVKIKENAKNDIATIENAGNAIYTASAHATSLVLPEYVKVKGKIIPNAMEGQYKFLKEVEGARSPEQMGKIMGRASAGADEQVQGGKEAEVQEKPASGQAQAEGMGEMPEIKELPLKKSGTIKFFTRENGPTISPKNVLSAGIPIVPKDSKIRGEQARTETDSGKLDIDWSAANKFNSTLNPELLRPYKTTDWASEIKFLEENGPTFRPEASVELFSKISKEFPNMPAWMKQPIMNDIPLLVLVSSGSKKAGHIEAALPFKARFFGQTGKFVNSQGVEINYRAKGRDIFIGRNESDANNLFAAWRRSKSSYEIGMALGFPESAVNDYANKRNSATADYRKISFDDVLMKPKVYDIFNTTIGKDKTIVEQPFLDNWNRVLIDGLGPEIAYELALKNKWKDLTKIADIRKTGTTSLSTVYPNQKISPSKKTISMMESGNAKTGNQEIPSEITNSPGVKGAPERSSEFMAAKELAGSLEKKGDYEGAGNEWRLAAGEAKSAAEAIEMCERAEAAYKKAGKPLEAARAYDYVLSKNPAFDRKTDVILWANTSKKVADILASLKYHENAGEYYSEVANEITQYCDANKTLPKEKMAELRELAVECSMKAGENFELGGLFQQAAEQYAKSNVYVMPNKIKEFYLQKAAECYEKVGNAEGAANSWERVRELSTDPKVRTMAAARELVNVLKIIKQMNIGLISMSYAKLALCYLRASRLETDPAKAEKYACDAITNARVSQSSESSDLISAAYVRLGSLATDKMAQQKYYRTAFETANMDRYYSYLHVFENLPENIKNDICNALATNETNSYGGYARDALRNIKNLEEERPGATAALYTKQGIRNFSRYEPSPFGSTVLISQFDKLGQEKPSYSLDFARIKSDTPISFKINERGFIIEKNIQEKIRGLKNGHATNFESNGKVFTAERIGKEIKIYQAVLLVAYPFADNNGAFTNQHINISAQMNKFDVVIVEATTVKELAKQFISVSNERGKIAAVFWGGHGAYSKTESSPGKSEVYASIKLGDESISAYEFMQGGVLTRLDPASFSGKGQTSIPHAKLDNEALSAFALSSESRTILEATNHSRYIAEKDPYGQISIRKEGYLTKYCTDNVALVLISCSQGADNAFAQVISAKFPNAPSSGSPIPSALNDISFRSVNNDGLVQFDITWDNASNVNYVGGTNVSQNAIAGGNAGASSQLSETPGKSKTGTGNGESALLNSAERPQEPIRRGGGGIKITPITSKNSPPIVATAPPIKTITISGSATKFKPFSLEKPTWFNRKMGIFTGKEANAETKLPAVEKTIKDNAKNKKDAELALAVINSAVPDPVARLEFYQKCSEKFGNQFGAALDAILELHAQRAGALAKFVKSDRSLSILSVSAKDMVNAYDAKYHAQTGEPKGGSTKGFPEILEKQAMNQCSRYALWYCMVYLNGGTEGLPDASPKPFSEKYGTAFKLDKHSESDIVNAANFAGSYSDKFSGKSFGKLYSDTPENFINKQLNLLLDSEGNSALIYLKKDIDVHAVMIYAQKVGNRVAFFEADPMKSGVPVEVTRERIVGAAAGLAGEAGMAGYGLNTTTILLRPQKGTANLETENP